MGFPFTIRDGTPIQIVLSFDVLAREVDSDTPIVVCLYGLVADGKLVGSYESASIENGTRLVIPVGDLLSAISRRIVQRHFNPEKRRN